MRAARGWPPSSAGSTPQNPVTGRPALAEDLAGLADGAHKFEVRAIDQAGNADQSPASFNGSRHRCPHHPDQHRPAALVKVANASFDVLGRRPRRLGVASFQCRIDSSEPGDWAPCTSPKAYSGLAEGSHNFEVRAIDEAGNADQSPDPELERRHRSAHHPDRHPPAGADQQSPTPASSSRALTPAARASLPSSAGSTQAKRPIGRPAPPPRTSPASPTAPTNSRCGRSITRATRTAVQPPSTGRSTPPHRPRRSTRHHPP